jgi:prevent-host-death family protein
MRSIGVRELRQNASAYLRLVEAGESVEVTDRGRPVALLVPIPEMPKERLIRLGILSPAKKKGNVLDVVPVEPVPGLPLPSETLQQDRDDRL